MHSNAPYYTITEDGFQATSGGTSANHALPTTKDGNTARRVLVACCTAAGLVYVRVGEDNTVAATTASTPVAFGEPVMLACRGQSYIAYLQGTTADKVTVVPVEDA